MASVLSPSTSKGSGLQVCQLHKEVTTQSGALTILEDIELELKPAETLAIVGASGSGKSTLLGILAGLDTPSAGQISLSGERLDLLDEDARAAVRAQHVGFIFQNFQLLPGLTALENVILPLELAGDRQALTKGQALMAEVGLAARMQHYPRQLSGGEQQRVAIARAFAITPSILFADEPTGNLDNRTGEQVAELLFQLNEQQGTTLVLVTHDLDLAKRCQRQLLLHNGRLQEQTR